jgi:hypothetical protein
MDLEEAKKNLFDYLFNGLQSDITRAEEARSAAVVIGKHAEAINKTPFGPLFGELQIIFSDRETLCVAKIFDRLNKRYPVRSISSILDLIRQNESLWDLPGREGLEEYLEENGFAYSSKRNKKELCFDIVDCFNTTLPSPSNASSGLGKSWSAVMDSRNKVLAHNEAISKANRILPMWSDTTALINYAKKFVDIVSYGFLEISETFTQPYLVPNQLEILMGLAGLVNEEFRTDPKKGDLIINMRKDLGICP